MFLLFFELCYTLHIAGIKHERSWITSFLIPRGWNNILLIQPLVSDFLGFGLIDFLTSLEGDFFLLRNMALLGSVQFAYLLCPICVPWWRFQEIRRDWQPSSSSKCCCSNYRPGSGLTGPEPAYLAPILPPLSSSFVPLPISVSFSSSKSPAGF